MMEIKEIVLKATELWSLEKVLRGEGEYRKEVSQFIGLEVPTDWPNVIRVNSNLVGDYGITII